MTNKIYTAQELREAEDFFVRNAEMVRQKVLSNAILANIHDSIPMLRYAAEVVERCENLKLNMIPHRHDKEIVDYILRGDEGNDNENK